MKPFFVTALVLMALLSGCAWHSDPERAFARQQDSTPLRPPRAEEMRDASPRPEPILPRGNKTPYQVAGVEYHLLEDYRGFKQRGTASWYGNKFHGRYTSNGEIYDVYAMTAAHKTLPIPVYVRVTNLDNGRQAVVRVNDRGPFRQDRIIDLSYSAAVKLGFAESGTAAVEIEVIDTDNSPQLSRAQRALAPDYYLQVAAFQQLDSAQRLEARLTEAMAVPVQIASSKERGPVIHRVRLGPFRDFPSVQQARKTLALVWTGTPQLLVEPQRK